jgi:hypothetical protein
MKGGGVSHGEAGTRGGRWHGSPSNGHLRQGRFRSPPVGPVLGIRKPPSRLLLCGMGVEQNKLISLHGLRPCRLPCPCSRGGAHFVLCQLCRSARPPWSVTARLLRTYLVPWHSKASWVGASTGARSTSVMSVGSLPILTYCFGGSVKRSLGSIHPLAQRSLRSPSQMNGRRFKSGCCDHPLCAF